MIPEVNDPVNNGSLNTETNESVLAAAVNTPASPGHVHTEACYLGHRHTDGTGVSSSSYMHGCYTNIATSNTICGGTYEYGGWAGWAFTQHKCPACGQNTCYDVHDIYHCNKCGNELNASIGSYCSVCGYNTFSGVGEYIGHSCFRNTTTTVYNCYLTEDNTLDCGFMLVNLTPTHPIQTVAAGDPLITTATATYKDGSTKVIECTSSFSTANIDQNQPVTLTYTYSISGVTYTKTCTITVTVVPRSKTCANGHTYNLNADGSDPGCPYCRSWLKSLEITYPDTGSITIYKGTSLADNGVTLLATYLDGRQEYLYNEYADNLDDQYVGTQNVTLSYKGKYITLIVITKRNLARCPICGRYYELYPDGSDPGCPYCQAKTPIFTGNVMDYYNKIYTNQILNELYEGSGIYYFTDRDYLLFNVKNSSKSVGMKILSFIQEGLGETGIQTIYGGYIRENGD
jgi:hypothetical protein